MFYSSNNIYKEDKSSSDGSLSDPEEIDDDIDEMNDVFDFFKYVSKEKVIHLSLQR